MHIGRRPYAFALGLLLLAFSQCVRTNAQEPVEVPKIILSGLEAYKAEGPEAAIKAWLKGSPIEGSKDALTQANNLHQIQDYYGTYKTFDTVRSRNLSPNTRIIYLILNYEKGPLFAKFVAYRTEQGWILVSFAFNTKDEIIIPACP